MTRTISICVVGVLALLCYCSLSSALTTPTIPATSTDASHSSSSSEPKAEPSAEPTPEPASKLAESTTKSASSSSAAASTTTTASGQSTTITSSLVAIKVTNGTVEAAKNGTKTEDCGFFCKLFS